MPGKSIVSFLTSSAKIPPIRKGDPKAIRGWIMYDWANSVYQLTISSAIFPGYYNLVKPLHTGNAADYLLSYLAVTALVVIVVVIFR